MRILIDIGHPAHVHFFKNFIWLMEKRGHKIKIVARDKDVAFQLLKAYGFDFVNLGKHKKGFFGKIKGLVEFDWKLYQVAKKFKPDVLLGIGSPYITHVGKIIGAKSVVFTDTEHAWIANRLAVPFATYVATPACFRKDFGKKHIRYNGYQELAYLHPKYFKPNRKVLKEFGIKEEEKFFVIRLVSWKAAHDVGQRGIDHKTLEKIVKIMENYGKIFISSEITLPEKLRKYKFVMPPEKMHDLLYYASLYVGEGATMATEAGLLGTPSIYASTSGNIFGVYDELDKMYKLVLVLSKGEEIIKKVEELIKTNAKKLWKRKREKVIKEKIDVTKWMMSFVEKISQ